MKKVFLLITLVMMTIVMKANHWEGDYSQFSSYTSVICVVQINGVEQTSTQLEIGAFCNGEVRGSKYAQLAPGGHYIYRLSCYGNTGDVFTFRLYDAALDKELDYLTCEVTVTYNGDVYGGVSNPFVISFTGYETTTFTLDITGYGTEDGNYYLIAPPFDDIDPAEIEGMTTGDFDLFYFDQAQVLEWRNYGTEPFNLESGKGYLYAHKTDVTLNFTGVPYSGDGKVTLDKTSGADFEGWNLVGNPFATAAILDRAFYVMNGAGDEIIPSTVTNIAAMQGIFVVAEEDGEEIQFTQSGSGTKNQIVLNVLQDRGNTIDRAIVRFNESSTLPKFMLDDSNTKLYIPQDDDDYAVVNANGENTLPVNFKAKTNGTYTISVDINNIEMDYLHLIDHLTGADVDLLQQPSYQFAADKNDYEARFMLVFRTETSVEENGQQNFCFVKDSHLYFIEDVQNAEFSLVDMNGRQVCHLTLKGNSCDLSGISEGLYIVRLAKDNDVKVQKVIIK